MITLSVYRGDTMQTTTHTTTSKSNRELALELAENIKKNKVFRAPDGKIVRATHVSVHEEKTRMTGLNIEFYGDLDSAAISWDGPSFRNVESAKIKMEKKGILMVVGSYPDGDLVSIVYKD